VPLSVIEGLTPQQTDTLAEHGINDIDALTQTSIDDLVEFLDLSLDEAEKILNAAKEVVAIRERTLQGETEGDAETAAAAAEETESGSETLGDAETEEESALTTGATAGTDPTAAGYDEAVENGVPFSAESEILAQDSADPVALTEVEAASEDEIALQEPGRDLRPDTIVPAPDITSAEVEAVENLESLEEFIADEEANGETEDVQTSAPASLEDAASSESTDEEKQDASPDAEN
jgi:hypothetical protein